MYSINGGVGAQTDAILPDVTGLGTAGPIPSLRGGSVVRWIGPLISICILAAVCWQLRTLSLPDILRGVPRTPIFWVAFLAWYFTGPAFDWLIFRKLWRIPAAGFAPLTRKLIGNELLLGYSGELYFYSWARERGELTSAPFVALKDVAILSALTGNLATLVMLAVAYPMLGELQLGLSPSTFAVSISIVLGTSMVAMIFRRSLFGLSRADLAFVFMAHSARIIVQTAILALLWHLMMPGQPLSLWLLLATVRLLISRLPLIPNKDFAFAGIATLVLGSDVAIATIITALAGVTLAAHVVIGTGLVGTDMLRWSRR